MFKSYASKVWLSMKFHFIGRCPGERGKGILMHLLSGGSHTVRQTFSQPGSRGTVGVPWDSALTGMAYLFPAHQGRDHTQFRLSAHFCSPNASWCYGQSLFPSLWHLPHRFSPERSLASSVSPSLLLEAQLCHSAHSSRWRLSILMVFNNLEWRFGITPLISTYDGGE